MIYSIFSNAKIGIVQGHKEYLNVAFGLLRIRDPAKTRYGDG